MHNFSHFKLITVSNFKYTKFTKVWESSRSVTPISYYLYGFVLETLYFFEVRGKRVSPEWKPIEKMRMKLGIVEMAKICQ